MAAKRRAILKTLADLGYEAREDMETAWVKDGRLVMRRAANPEMGVEVRGAEQLQFRPARFGSEASANDRSKDRDIETVWCSDFDELHKHVLGEQGELKIERLTPVGTTPVLFEVESVDEGARLLCGGLGRPEEFNSGYYVKPTVFADVKPGMTIEREEILPGHLGTRAS